MSVLNPNSFKKHVVAIIFGSKTDAPQMKECCQMLDKLEISYSARVLSAHRTPMETAQFAQNAHLEGYEVIIAGAGASAALPGAIAAHTLLPVIGVPLNTTSLGGLDSLLAICQMPANVPVATMAIGSAGAKNASLLAARILALKYPQVAEKLREFVKKTYEEAKATSEIDPFANFL